MSVIGVNVTESDTVHGWESVESTIRHSPAMVRYLEALQEAEQAWRDYTAQVDSWIESGLYEEMNAAAEHAESLDAQAHVLYNQANCPHEHVDYVGGMHFGADGAWDDIRPVCIDCGAEIELDLTGDVSPEDEIPF